jgi:hypothetical protein
MEFKDIKNTWKDSFKDNELLSKKEIEAKLRIKSKSNTALNKVKRNYKFELITGGIISVLFISIMYIDLTSKYRLLFVLITVLFFGLLLSVTWRNYRRIRKTVFSNKKLKPALIKTISDIEHYVNFNKSNFTKYLLLPFAISFGMVIGSIMGSNEQEFTEIFTITKIFGLVITLIITSVIFVPISQYLNKKMYKQHVDELKHCLKDFEEIDD